MKPIAPRHGHLVPRDAAEELARQDAARAEARKTASKRAWRDSFHVEYGYELELASKWGAEADTVGDPPTIVRRIRDKYPPRKPGRFIRWLFQFRNRIGAPIFQYNPAPRGFIFNEGGRFMTLSMTRMVPFRLYLAGLVLNVSQKGRVTLQSRIRWEDGLLKKLGWVRLKKGEKPTRPWYED